MSGGNEQCFPFCTGATLGTAATAAIPSGCVPVCRSRSFTVLVTNTKRAARIAALATAGLLALSACGDSDTGSNAAAASEGDKATGTPILVGYINDDTGPLPQPEQTTGAKAAAAYVNSHGGVNGHPIELVTCASSASPESTIACANEMIEKKVVAVTLGSLVGADSLAKPLTEAKIPVWGTNASGVQLSSNPAMTFGSMPNALVFAGVWKFFNQVNTKTVVLVGPDAGKATKDLANNVIIPSAKAAGLELSYIAYNPASPDFAAAITAAMKKNADGIFINGGEAECTNGLKTAKQLGFKGVLFSGTCTQYAKTLGAQAAGIYSLNFLVPSTAAKTAPATKQEQLTLYTDAMKAAGAEDKITSPANVGFSTVMTAADMLRKVTGEVTAATATTAISTYAGDVFLASPIDCTKRPVPGGSCGTSFLALQTEADGTQTVVSGDFIDATKA
jgi:branched-chain amino acid transport system substrate-binding protein